MSPEASARTTGAPRRSASRPATPLPPRPVPDGRPDRQGHSPLSVVDRRALAVRARRRRQRLLLATSGLLVAGALSLVALAEGLVTSQQLHLDGLDARIAAAVTTTQDLEIAKAQLSEPSRILRIAEGSLHMVSPAHVTYLEPVTSPASTPAAPGVHGRRP